MKMTKRLFLYLLGLAAFVGLMTSCAKEDKFTQVSSLSFSSTPSSLAPGQTHKLQVKAFPADADEPYTLVFASSKPEVATVDAQGTVTAIKDGQTVISVSLKDRPEVKAESPRQMDIIEKRIANHQIPPMTPEQKAGLTQRDFAELMKIQPKSPAVPDRGNGNERSKAPEMVR